jgi:hypothetical protein
MAYIIIIDKTLTTPAITEMYPSIHTQTDITLTTPAITEMYPSTHT